MTPEQLKELQEDIKKQLEEFANGETIKGMVDSSVKESVSKSMALLKAERQTFGKDRTGLTDEEKKEFCTKLYEFIKGKGHASEIGAQGGLLIPSAVFAGIMRIAEITGHILSKAMKFNLSGISELRVPRYTGSVLEGDYIDIDEEITETSITFGDALLDPKMWALIFRIDNRLLKNANVNVVDFLMSLIAEGLSFKIDKQGFTGTKPFIGLLEDTAVPTVTMSSGNVDFDDLTADDLNDMILAVKKDARARGGFYMHSSILGVVQKLKDSNGNYLVANQNQLTQFNFNNETIMPDGIIWGKPIYTLDDILPALAASAVSTKFMVFGDLQKFYYGDRGQMEIAQSDSATITDGSTRKNVFSAVQTALRAVHEHAVVVGLQNAFVTLKTAAS